ncbi:MAG: glycoside hydrolase family 3 C-terminal domain-containing protein [Candidatus Brockarchaeota archaeon]|nr:glycoside hydrolase family 3 C-terminal domain-containing protein [Candidatus Brockarchaeota archaeon]
MGDKPVYLDSSAPVDLRVKDLLRRMTLEEKIAQLQSLWLRIGGEALTEDKFKELAGKGIGEITRVSGALGVKPGEGARIVNEIQKFLVEETRLGIPAIIHEECLTGFLAMGATAFPQAIGLASTWNPELIEQVASVIRRQMRACGAHQGLAPVLDVARDPRWGRTEETYGEDPYLVARMGVSYVKGLQGEDLRNGIIATAKHFAAHGFPEGGRNCAPVHATPREFREVFLFPFEAVVKLAGVYSIMNAYHDIDGVPCASSRALLTDILRGEWGFNGFVVSDYFAIRMLENFHYTASDAKDAAVKAIIAGIDVELPSVDCYGKPLLDAVSEGLVPEGIIDTAVSRVLRAKFLLGLFENPYVNAEEAAGQLDREEDRALALRAARESIVLLKNNGVLPIPSSVRSIAVVGPNADSKRNLHGDYSFTAHMDSKDRPPGYDEIFQEGAVRTVSILQGIRNRAPPGVNINYAKGCDITGDSKEGFKEAVDIAMKSDVVIAVMGEKSGMFETGVSGEGCDRYSLKLPGVQEDLMKELCNTGKPIVLVLVNGRPLSLGWIAEKCSAIIEAWYPGEEGGNAVADVLFGHYNPGGKLPITFPKDVGQIPLNYSRRHSSFRNYVGMDAKPLFPFGHGLSYTRFEYSSLEINPSNISPMGQVKIRFKLKNSGERTGDEVAQLYVRDTVASVARPVMELKGFKRVSLKPGEVKEVEFTLFAEQLAFYDEYMRLVVEPGVFEVMIGSSSEDIRLRGEFKVVGETRVIKNRTIFFSEVEVK